MSNDEYRGINQFFDQLGKGLVEGLARANAEREERALMRAEDWQDAITDVQCWSQYIDETRVLLQTGSGSVYVFQCRADQITLRQLVGETLEVLCKAHAWTPFFRANAVYSDVETHKVHMSVKPSTAPKDAKPTRIITSYVENMATV